MAEEALAQTIKAPAPEAVQPPVAPVTVVDDSDEPVDGEPILEIISQPPSPTKRRRIGLYAKAIALAAGASYFALGHFDS